MTPHALLLRMRLMHRSARPTLRCLSTDLTEEITVPKRIPRGPTDILRALESTLKRDPTAAHYKYHDDPYLIPLSNMNKRAFAMSKEAGRKAAHWVREQHADLFQHRDADPEIKAFIPKMVFNEETAVSEADLQQFIADNLLTDAATIYKLLKKRGVDVTAETQQQLLELVCFHNEAEGVNEEFIEERWFTQSTKGKERQRKTWNDGGLAEELFISFEQPNAAAYSAIIQGMVKYGQGERALQLFQEAQTKELQLPVQVYNSMITAAPLIKEGYNLRWDFAIDVLTMMHTARVRPNLGTLNAMLETLSTMGGGHIVKANILKTLAEFKVLGIEPSLASWYFVLQSYCRSKGPTSPILHDIINQIEGKQLQIRDVKDIFFFVTAMDVCNTHLQDCELANRLHKLLNHASNYDLIGDSYKESIYYRNYVTLMCRTQPLDEFMKFYGEIVPHIYVPEPSVLSEILTTIEAHAAIEYIPIMWSHLIIFDHTSRENLLTQLVQIMAQNEPDNDALKGKFAQIALQVWQKYVQQDENRIQKLKLTGEVAGDILTVLLKQKDFENACKVMEKLYSEQQSIVGVPSFEALALFVDSCVEEAAPTRAINCIQYCADSGYANLDDLVRRLSNGLTLDETHYEKLSGIVGPQLVNKFKNEKENVI